MAFRVAHVVPGTRLSEAALGTAFARHLPRSLIHAVLAETRCRERRCRRLPAELVVLLAIAASLFPDDALERVGARLLTGFGCSGRPTRSRPPVRAPSARRA